MLFHDKKTPPPPQNSLSDIESFEGYLKHFFLIGNLTDKLLLINVYQIISKWTV
jgi:hypothetical protein